MQLDTDAPITGKISLYKMSRFLLMVALSALLSYPAAAHAFPSSQARRYEKAPFAVGNEVGLQFMKTDAYKNEFNTAIEGAYAACRQFMKQPPSPQEKRVRPAVVADIDETLLDNREHFKAHKEFSWPAFESWIHEAKAPALDKTADFLQWARDNGFAVFLVTGRREGLRSSTIANLVHAKVAYDGLLMRKDGDKRGAESVKSELRKQIEDLGFTVVVNIGDQYSDLSGGYAIDCEKLPNRIYFVD